MLSECVAQWRLMKESGAVIQWQVNAVVEYVSYLMIFTEVYARYLFIFTEVYASYLNIPFDLFQRMQTEVKMMTRSYPELLKKSPAQLATRRGVEVPEAQKAGK